MQTRLGQSLQLLLLLCLISLRFAAGGQDGDEEAVECEDVSKLGRDEDRCAFVMAHCEQQSYFVFYLKAYYCRILPHGAAAATLTLLGSVCILALLFRVMARTADDFFACILSQISQDMGLPPRLGGVTLLALGNGAPDLSSSIAAVKTGNYRMALGALTGAGMFVGCVVAGRILTLNGGAKARWAQIRDVFSYLLAAAVVMGILASGSFTYGSVLTLLLLYGGYVVVVAVADFTKRAGVEWDQLARSLTRNISLRIARRGVELGAPLLGRRSPSPIAEQLSEASDTLEPRGPFAQAAYPASDDQSMELSPVATRQRLSQLHLDLQQQASQEASNGSAEEPRPRVSDRMEAYLEQQQQQAAVTAPPLSSVRHAHTLPAQLPRPSSLPTQLPRPTLPSQLALPSSAPPRGWASTPGGGNTPDGGSAGAASDGGRPRSAVAAGAAAGAEGEGVRRGFTLPLLHLPELHLPDWLQLPHRHGEHPNPNVYARRGPPVAAFQPRMPYSDLVRMPAREYRQRALAEMAQSRSFYVRGRGRPPRREGDESGSETGDESSYGSDMERGRSGYAPPVLPPPPPTQQQQPGPELESPSGQSPEGQPMRVLQTRLGGERETSPAAPGWASAPALGGARGDKEAAAVQPAVGTAAAAAAAAEVEGGGARTPPVGLPPAVRFAPPSQQPSAQAAAAAVAAGPGGPLPAPLERHTTHYGQYEFGDGTAGHAAPGGRLQIAEAEGAEEEGGAEGPKGPFSKFVGVVETPIMLALQATVPLVEPNSYHRHWFLASMAISPFFICLYLKHLWWLPLLVAAMAGAALCALAAAGTRDLGEQAPIWSCGTGFPVGAALVAVYGFAVAAMWISLFAQEIVAILHFLGTLSGIDSGVLGLTVLAWGNSLMDLINNTSMAGKSAGGNSMAMTACYAGPLFNLLLGLGIGFWSLLGEEGAAAVPVALPLNAALGFGAIISVCAAIVAVALLNDHWLPQRFGWAMIGWYFLYLSVVLLCTVL